MECTRCNKKDVFGADRSLACRHGRSFDYRKQVALYTLPRDVRSSALFRFPGHLIDLVDEDDTGVLYPLDRFACDSILIDELGRLFLLEYRTSLFDGDAARFLTLG